MKSASPGVRKVKEVRKVGESESLKEKIKIIMELSVFPDFPTSRLIFTFVT